MAMESANEGLDADGKILTVRLFGSHEAAGIAAARLEANGLQCWISSDDCGGMYPNLTTASGVRLKVRAEDFAEATALLEAEPSPTELKQLEVEAVVAAPIKSEPPKKLAWLQIGLGVFLGIFLCQFFQGQSEVGKQTHYAYTDDGKCYEAWLYHDGLLVEVLKDRALSGRWDAWFYYYRGLPVRAAYDENHDGKADLWVTYSNSSPASEEQDVDYNGIPDIFTTYSNGQIQQLDVRPNGLKFAITREIFKHGLLTEIWRGGDSQGNFNTFEKYDLFLNEVESTHHYLTPPNTNVSGPFELLTPIGK